ncbi:hypothetical protein PMI14_02219 [Acidovorax sp. CF316]|uniref:hypothetical protein n=1 Tax=Acidovorax sp. CF316 TaxID=1144317 RepID=UPI00026BC6F9|nr:hypothetical protein [Acidovorax sp. CF316]EJE53145.1 hypothetical protein PMI14_02219 [Acidovorax sp. CF316]
MDSEHSEEDLHLIELQAPGGLAPPLQAGVSASGLVYLRGDLHPLGSATALIKAAREHVPYAALGAVNVLFPADWLRGECLHDADRLRVIAAMERLVRGAAAA